MAKIERKYLAHFINTAESGQAVYERLGKDLEACAHSEDGYVEAVVHTAHPFCLGVQWHPEHPLPPCTY